MRACFTVIVSSLIDCYLTLAVTMIVSCWPGLGSVLRLDVCPCLFCVVFHSDGHSLLGSARECPGSTCISPVWLEKCDTDQPGWLEQISYWIQPGLQVECGAWAGLALVPANDIGMSVPTSRAMP